MTDTLQRLGVIYEAGAAVCEHAYEVRKEFTGNLEAGDLDEISSALLTSDPDTMQVGELRAAARQTGRKMAIVFYGGVK